MPDVSSSYELRDDSFVPGTYKYWLVVAPNYRVQLRRLPSRWHRFWVGLLLGFKYESVWTDEGADVRVWRHQMMSGHRG